MLGTSLMIAIAADDLLGSLSLNKLKLNQFSFTNIPRLEKASLGNFNGWQRTQITHILDLDKLLFVQFLINLFQIFRLIALHNMTYGKLSNRIIKVVSINHDGIGIGAQLCPSTREVTVVI